MKAIDRFDPARETAFSSFAVPTIVGELKRHFRDQGWSVRVPRDLQDLAIKVGRLHRRPGAHARAGAHDGRARRARGRTVEQVLEARPGGCARTAPSRWTVRAPRTDEDERRRRATASAPRTPATASSRRPPPLQRLIRVLSAREREVLRLRFEEDLTQAEIGARVGISQMHVSRMIRQSIALLRDAADRG